VAFQVEKGRSVGRRRYQFKKAAREGVEVSPQLMAMRGRKRGAGK